MVPFLVSKFAKSTMSNLVKECFGADFPDIFNKDQIGYIYRYLNDLSAKWILLEFQYVDRDYLEDYSRYYLKRFNNNGYKCARLHFFSSEINHSLLETILSKGDTSEEKVKLLQKTYLGFMVIKPLPKTFIGKTCLKHYAKFNHKNGDRFALGRSYNVDLFGIKLCVDSIAFQEQDKVVAACATTAIWSSLHALEWRQIRDVPACSEVTTNAINFIEGSSNSFPTKELSNKQIMRALDFEKLRCHTTVLPSAISKDEFLNVVKYYIDSKLPLILGVDVYRLEDQKHRKLAGHAVTVLGYKKAKTKEELDAIYIHDDRLGPFARALFTSLEGKGIDKTNTWGLMLQEKSDDRAWRTAHEILVPDTLIVPTHQKVRLPHEFAENTCSLIKTVYIDQASDAGIENPGVLDYSLQLVEISKVRQEVFNNPIITTFSENGTEFKLNDEEINLLEDNKIKFLTGSYARFHWQAVITINTTPALRILFDATEIPQGNAISAVYIEHKWFGELILELVTRYANKKQDKVPSPQTFLMHSLHIYKPGLVVLINI